jgi:hypothetical protein
MLRNYYKTMMCVIAFENSLKIHQFFGMAQTLAVFFTKLKKLF